MIEWFHNLAKTVKETFEGIRTAWDSVKDFFSDTLDVLGIEFEDGTGSWKLFFSNFFQFAQIGLLKLSQKIDELWDNTVGYLNAIGEGIGTSLAGGTFSEGFANRRERTKREAEETAKIYEATIADIENGITESQKRIAAERQRLAEKYRNNPVGEGTQSDSGLRIGANKDAGKGKSGGTALSKSAEARDTWTPYYEQILELDIRSKGELEQLEWEHARKISEFNAVIAENTIISETEKNNALLIHEQDYQKQKTEIEKSAMDFLNSLNPEDEEIVRLQESYVRKEVYAALVDLCVDICRRNGKKRLLWIADRDKALSDSVKSDEMLLTVHRWFARKSCPGNWLFGKLGDLAQAVNSQLGE